MNRPRLLHYSDRAITKVHSVAQVPVGEIAGQNLWGKPEGLWVATDEGWAEYCKGVGMRRGWQWCYEVRLKSDACILTISNGAELDRFTRIYGRGNPLDAYFPELSKAGWSEEAEHHAIDWPDLARRYQGILIHPYIADQRLSSFNYWYYGWDVASGVIWDADAIRALDVVEVPHHDQA
jgi:hypothetical protein